MVLCVVLVVVWLTLPVPSVEDIGEKIGSYGWWGGVVFVAGYGILSPIRRANHTTDRNRDDRCTRP